MEERWEEPQPISFKPPSLLPPTQALTAPSSRPEPVLCAFQGKTLGDGGGAGWGKLWLSFIPAFVTEPGKGLSQVLGDQSLSLVPGGPQC